MSNKLEPSAEEIREMLEITTDRIIDHLDNLANPAAFDLEKSREQAFLQSEALPEKSMPFKEILDDLFDNKIPHSLQTASPGFMSYIPGGGIVHSAIAELIAKATNRYVGVDFAAPFLAQIEADVLKWFCQMVGYPASSGGTLTSGGSIANLTAVICARTLIMGDDFSKATVYASGYVHHSNWKAFLTAGISSEQIRKIPIDENFRMDTRVLEQTLQQDKKLGFTPTMIIATAGSTNTGTIDDLGAIAELSNRFNCWFHIDAAYGGLFAMTKKGSEKLVNLNQADSITLDPHKSLFQPYGTGAIIAKDKENLKKVFQHTADYMPENQSPIDVWDFSDMSLELTRPFRGLGIWLAFKMLGAGVFREALEEKLQLADYFCDQISKCDDWKIVAEPELSLTVFRYQNNAKTKQQLNHINQRIIEHVNNKLRTNLSGTVVDGFFVLRCCILSHRTHRIHIDWLLDDLDDALKTVAYS